MTLDEIENRISEIYHFFSVTAGPSVRPRETGDLGAYWAMFDREVIRQVEDMSAEEVAYEFGRVR